VPVEAQVVEHVEEAGADDGERHGQGSMFQACPGSMPFLLSCRAKTNVPTMPATAMMMPYQWKGSAPILPMTGSMSIVMPSRTLHSLQARVGRQYRAWSLHAIGAPAFAGAPIGQ